MLLIPGIPREPAKLVAKLRAWKTNDNLLLLKTNMGAGHFSVTGRWEISKHRSTDTADDVRHPDAVLCACKLLSIAVDCADRQLVCS